MCTTLNTWENLQIHKHNIQNKLIPEEMQSIQNVTQFLKLNIRNIQKTNTYTTSAHNRINVTNQKPIGTN